MMRILFCRRMMIMITSRIITIAVVGVGTVVGVGAVVMMSRGAKLLMLLMLGDDDGLFDGRELLALVGEGGGGGSGGSG